MQNPHAPDRELHGTCGSVGYSGPSDPEQEDEGFVAPAEFGRGVARVGPAADQLQHPFGRALAEVDLRQMTRKVSMASVGSK